MSDDPKLELDEPGVGKLLRERREQQGLTQQDVAASLNLRVAAIEALEAERFDLLPPRTFVRGYLRAYAKLVGLAEAEVLAAFGATPVDEPFTGPDIATRTTPFLTHPALTRHRTETAPLLEHYRDVTVTVDAIGEIAEINARALTALGK